jgi:hypothetical protein
MSRTSSDTSWTIRVESAATQAHTFACQEKDGCFVSAHTKLAGFGKHVALSTEALADDFRTAIYPIMRKRHGDSVELILLRIQTVGRGKACKIDDEIVLARIRDRNFAPNVAAIK